MSEVDETTLADLAAKIAEHSISCRDFEVLMHAKAQRRVLEMYESGKWTLEQTVDMLRRLHR